MAAGCSTAAGLAGSNHSHLAVHTAVASAAVGTASLPGPREPGPACQGGSAVLLGDHRSLLGMDCSAAAGSGGGCPSHTTEVSSSPLGPWDCPEPIGPSAACGSRASRSNYYPLLSEGSAHSQNAAWTRPPAPPPSPASRERGTPAAGALGLELLSPSCLRSPCQPAFLCLFSRLKGALRGWKTSLTSRQNREKGLGSKVARWTVQAGQPRQSPVSLSRVM